MAQVIPVVVAGHDHSFWSPCEFIVERIHFSFGGNKSTAERVEFLYIPALVVNMINYPHRGHVVDTGIQS